MLTERKVLEQVEVHISGNIFAKYRNEVLRDGIVISSIPHRESMAANDPAAAKLLGEHLKNSQYAAAAEELKNAQDKADEKAATPA